MGDSDSAGHDVEFPQRQSSAFGGPGDGPTAAPSPPQRRKRRAPPKLYRIGEVVEYAGVSRQTVHNYTTMGLLQERRWTPGGHRLYDEDVFERLEIIAELKAQQKSLQDIRAYFERLQADGKDPAPAASRDDKPPGGPP